MPIGSRRLHALNLEISDIREIQANDLTLQNPSPHVRRRIKNASLKLRALQDEKRRHDSRYAALR